MSDEGAAATLKVFLRPERRFVAEGRPTELIVLVRLLPAPSPAAPPAPRNLAVLVERGGGAPYLRAIKDGLHAAVDALAPHDSFSLVTIGAQVETAIPSVRATAPEALHREIERLEPHVGPRADLRSGWLGAALEAAASYDRRALNRVVIVTADSAITSPAERLVEEGRGLFRRGISTSLVGVGDTFAEDALVPLCVQSGGNLAYARSSAEVVDAIVAEVRSTERLFSEWSTLRFDVDGGEIVDVLNDLPWIGERKVSLPPLYVDAPLNVVVRIRMRAETGAGELSPLTVRIKHLDLRAGQAVVHRKSMPMHVVSAALADSMAPDIGVQAHAARLEFARMHAKCIRKLDEGDVAAARQLLDFSLSRFQSLSGQSGGTLLTDDLAAMARLRERLHQDNEQTRSRKLLRLSAVAAQRGGLTRLPVG